MFALIARLFVLRPLLGVAILGIPVLGLIALGLATVVVLKLLFFVVLPIALVAWIVKRVLKPHDDLASTPTQP
jgi:hypothetical protein